ncbi:MAG: UDP-3-O-(3-hydroxymyristoyl) glucosamine N-acyltransferase [Gammaproteobacteria bacterium]|jgi:acetyltransferase-like isoleucine patch superfamily enzyme|nr:UDP-3-O-(3-hydroxymyristoyl) glucosamine N-acyltransferase [Gammaproteobacteria bacterium]
MTNSISTLAVIGKNVSLGEGVVIHPFVVINDNVIIGNNVEIFPGAYIGKEPKGAGALARKIEFEKLVTIGDNCSIGPHATIYYDVEIKNNVLVGDCASIREGCKIGQYCVISRCVTINYNVTIGDYTKIMDSTHITGDCMIGKHVFIGMLVATSNDNKLGGQGYSDSHVVGPTIEDYAAIGSGASIFASIRVGEGAIVGSNAVVTKDVPSRKVVMGIPAREVRDA